MKIWITSYALTEGIKEYDATAVANIPDMMEYAPGRYVHGEGNGWHRMYGDALVRAEGMRLAKIRLLRAQIRRLEALQF